ANWSAPQTVTVTGVDDQVQDGAIAYNIVLGAAASVDPIYAGMDPADVALSNADNDAAGITVAPTSGLLTSEAGGSATFSVVLNSQPTADVVIPVASSNAPEGTVFPYTTLFTAANWSAPQTVTVTGVDDQVQDGAIAYSVALGVAASSDPIYAGMDAADVALSNTDNDVAGITVTPTPGLLTSEAGGTATFSVVLNSQPTADVVIPLPSTEATLFPYTTLFRSFTAANWSAPQTVTVTGVDDQVQDGAIAFGVALGAAVSSDPIYAGMDPADVALSNTDNDVAGITVTPTSGPLTSEAGGTATFTVVLNSQPTADVVIPVASSDATEGIVSASTLTFTAANWSAPQTVTVTGADDQVQDGAIAYSVVLGTATSSDPIYAGMDPADVALTNADNDAAGITVAPTSGLATSEAGRSATFSLLLDS